MNEALVLLVLLWAVLLVPSALRSRSSSSPHVTVGGFERAMDVLRTSPTSSGGRSSTGRQLLVPKDAGRIVDHVDPPTRPASARGADAAPPPRVSATREDPTIAARRMWFTRLLAGSALSVVLALVFGGIVWLLAGAAVAGTVAYAALLRRWKVQRDEVRSVVRELELDAEPRVPVGAAVGASGSSGTVRLRTWEG